MKRIAVYALMALLAGFNSLFAQTEVIILTEDFPPLNYVENGQLVGPSVEVVKRIIKILGLHTDIKTYPWKRGYSIALNEKNTCLFSTTRPTQREYEFKWVGPLAEKRYVFYALKKNHIKIDKLEDAKKLNIAVQMGGASADALEVMGFKNLDPAIAPEHSMKKLYKGRTTLWYTSIATPLILAKRTGLDLNKIEEVFVVKKSKLYVAFNVATADEVIRKWQGALDKLYKDGTVRVIFEKYGFASMMTKKK